MKVEHLRSSTYRITLQRYELAAVISALRWAVDGAEGELPQGAQKQLSQIVTDYDAEMKQMSKPKAES